MVPLTRVWQTNRLHRRCKGITLSRLIRSSGRIKALRTRLLPSRKAIVNLTRLSSKDHLQVTNTRAISPQIPKCFKQHHRAKKCRTVPFQTFKSKAASRVKFVAPTDLSQCQMPNNLLPTKKLLEQRMHITRTTRISSLAQLPNTTTLWTMAETKGKISSNLKTTPTLVWDPNSQRALTLCHMPTTKINNSSQSRLVTACLIPNSSSNSNKFSLKNSLK